MARHVIALRVVALGFVAECTVCTRWIYWKLEWEERDRADEDLRCPICGGTCVPDMETVAMEFEVTSAGR